MSKPLTGEDVAQVRAGLEVLRGHAAYATRDDIRDGVRLALTAIADLERQLAETKDAMEKALVVELGLRAELTEAQARLRKANCDYGDGWLSDDLECQVDAEPWCGKHAVLYYIRENKKAQGKLDAVKKMTEDWRGNPSKDDRWWLAALARILKEEK